VGLSRLVRTTALLAGLLTAPAAAQQSIVLDVEAGATFDAIIDGFPMLAAYDGVPDFPTGYNTLSIALQIAVTEERGIGEFPLAPLDGVSPAAIASATLTFNVDDVIASFGPGTGFTGAAARDILLHLYPANGEIEVDDYLEVERAGHAVDTRSHGRITDQTLAASGPLRFDVDVTDDLRALLATAPVAIGVVWRSGDAGTATSLDHLGNESAGPPGINGSYLPYLTVVLGAAASPTPTATATLIAATPTATAIAATPTATQIATPTATGNGATPTVTPTGGAGCIGDCDGDGAVTVNELIAGVNLALGTASSPCPAIDRDGDGTVVVAELVSAVAAALDGC
jgi:hypothetical protein